MNQVEAFERAITFLLSVEDPDGTGKITEDSGGLTKFGISQRAYPDLDIRALTRDGAIAIYEADYWRRCNCGDLPPGLGLLVFDSAVNQGQPTACRMLQRALGVKPVDGIIGPQTIAAANVDPLKTILEYGALRANSYAQTVGVPQSGLGWFRRLFRAFNMAVNLPR